MASAREIRSKITSIKNTQKITRAMEMVAASKMRKAQHRMLATRPYAEKINTVIGHLAKSHPEFHHLYLEQRPIKRAGFIVISSDRGLCGSLNINLLKNVLHKNQTLEIEGSATEFCLLGHKAEAFFKRVGGNIQGVATHLGDTPNLNDLIGIVKLLFDHYENEQIDVLFVAYNEFINTMVQKPRIQQLLPLVPTENGRLDYYWDYIYEPEAREVLTVLLQRYLESQVYHALIENLASEQAARMVAMKNASENAGQIIDDLQLAYNKARQSTITKELADIIAGSEALSEQ